MRVVLDTNVLVSALLKRHGNEALVLTATADLVAGPRRIHRTALRRASARRSQKLQALKGVRVLAHEQNERGSLVVRFAPPLFPALERARVDTDTMRECRTRHVEAFARAPNDPLIDTRQRQPFDPMRA